MLDTFASFGNLDIAFIAEFATRATVASITEVPKKYSAMNSYLSGSHPNYYEAGKLMGDIFKNYMDLNLINWGAHAFLNCKL